MGCASCGGGPRYSPAVGAGLTPSKVRVTTPSQETRLAVTRGEPVQPKIFNVEIGSVVGATTQQPQPAESTQAPVPQYAIDPSTGHYVSVIKTGKCPEADLTNVVAQPEKFEIESYEEDANEKKEE